MVLFTVFVQSKTESNEKSWFYYITGEKSEEVHVLNFGVEVHIVRSMKGF